MGQTFDGVGFGKLRTVLHELGGEVFPVLVGGHAEVDVCAGEFVGVEPDVAVPAVFD